MNVSSSSLSGRTLSVTLFFGGLVLSILASGVLALHARSFSLKRDTAVMIGTTLPELRASVDLLAANRQAALFFEQHGQRAREEQASVYVLPDTPSGARAVSALQAIVSALQGTQTTLSLERITMDPAPVDRGEFKTLRAELVLRGDYAAVSRFLSVLDFSGRMMIRDVLTDEASTSFLKQINAIAPLSLKAAEDFLFADLVAYAAEPDRIEQDMFKDVPLEAQPEIRAFLLASGLGAVRLSLSDIAPALRSKNVWPLPLLSVNALRREGERWTMDLVLYRR